MFGKSTGVGRRRRLVLVATVVVGLLLQFAVGASAESGSMPEVTENEAVTPPSMQVETHKQDTGSLRIKKHASDDTHRSFSFTGPKNGGGSGTQTFSLKHTDNTGHVTTNLPTGTWFTFTETVPSGWELDKISCDNNVAEWDRVGNSLKVKVKKDKQGTCTFTNKKIQMGKVTIVKEAPGGGNTEYTFTVPSNGGPGTETVQLGAGESHEVDGLVAGTSYTFTETPTANWDLTGIVCKEGPHTVNATVDLTAGSVTVEVKKNKNITCTFTNTYNPQPGSVIVRKFVTGDPAPMDAFEFTVTDGSETHTPTLGDGDESDVYTFPAGTEVTVTENDPGEGWTTAWRCERPGGTASDDGRSVDLHILPGTAWDCTFTNTYTAQTGSITIVKQAPGAGNQEKFIFSVSGQGTKPTKGPNGTITFSDLPAGEYTISEQDKDGWFPQGVTCSNDASSDGASVTVVLAAGENITCTFNNAKAGALKVVKLAYGGKWNEKFTFDVDPGDLEKHTLGAFGFFSLNNLAPGSVITVDEAEKEGWTLHNVYCLGAGTSVSNGVVSYTVKAGKTAICTFINKMKGDPDPDPVVTVTKVVTGDPPSGTVPAEGFMFNIDGTAHALSPGETSDPQSVEPGDSVLVSENVPNGWELTDIACYGPDQQPVGTRDGDAVYFDMPDGNVHCVFTNKYVGPEATLTIVKTISGTTSSQEFRFTISPSQEKELELLGDGDSDDWTLVPDTYTVTEVAVSGWRVSGIVCLNDGNKVGSSNTTERSVTIALADGDDVTCTFTNVRSGTETEGGDPPPPPPPPPSPPETEVTPDEPTTGPEPSDDTGEETPPPPPATGPDLPFTGGTYVWHLLAGAALTVTGSAGVMRRRPRRSPGARSNH